MLQLSPPVQGFHFGFVKLDVKTKTSGVEVNTVGQSSHEDGKVEVMSKSKAKNKSSVNLVTFMNNDLPISLSILNHYI